MPKISSHAGSRVRSRIAWGATVGGLLVATTMFMLIGSFAAAVGSGWFLWERPGIPLWIFLLTVASMFVGGYTASYLSDGESLGEAFLQGIILWGATALLLVYLTVHGVSLVGAETLLGFPEGAFAPEDASAAWWAFGGVVVSLTASIIGSLAASFRLTRQRAQRRLHPRGPRIQSQA